MLNETHFVTILKASKNLIQNGQIYFHRRTKGILLKVSKVFTQKTRKSAALRPDDLLLEELKVFSQKTKKYQRPENLCLEVQMILSQKAEGLLLKVLKAFSKEIRICILKGQNASIKIQRSSLKKKKKTECPSSREPKV